MQHMDNYIHSHLINARASAKMCAIGFAPKH